MSVIPVSNLSPDDLEALGNNLLPRHGRTDAGQALRARRRRRRQLSAVNRSLAWAGECVDRLYPSAPQNYDC